MSTVSWINNVGTGYICDTCYHILYVSQLSYTLPKVWLYMLRNRTNSTLLSTVPSLLLHDPPRLIHHLKSCRVDRILPILWVLPMLMMSWMHSHDIIMTKGTFTSLGKNPNLFANTDTVTLSPYILLLNLKGESNSINIDTCRISLTTHFQTVC